MSMDKLNIEEDMKLKFFKLRIQVKKVIINEKVIWQPWETYDFL